MALSDKTKRIVAIVSLGEFVDADGYIDPSFVMEFKGRILKALGDVRAREYAFILHDLDLKEDGTFKLPHFHIWAECSATSRISTYINKMAKSLGVNPLAVSCQPSVSNEGSIQYLIHKNDVDKHQYHKSEIMTNIPLDELDVILERPTEAFSVDYIVNCYQASKTFRDFVKAIGLNRYNQYRHVIRDLIKYE